MSERICWNVILLQTLQQPNNKQDPMGENFFQARITMGENTQAFEDSTSLH